VHGVAVRDPLRLLVGSLRVDHRRRDLAPEHAAVRRGAGRVEQLDEQLHRRPSHAGHAGQDAVRDVHPVWRADLHWRCLHLVLCAGDEAVDARGDGRHQPLLPHKYQKANEYTQDLVFGSEGTAQADLERMEEINAEIGLTQLIRGEGVVTGASGSDAEKPKVGETTERL